MELNYSYCRGALVWDYERGEIVCTLTGEVVDRIYDYSPVYEKQETIERIELNLRNRPRRNPIEKKYSRDYHIYMRARNRIKNKPWLSIDYDKLFKTRRFIRTITSYSTLKALDNIERLGLREKLEEILGVIEAIEPSALARTERARNALAYILLNIIEYSRPPDPRQTIEIFQISITTYRRLERVAKRIYSKLAMQEKPVIVRTTR